MSIILKSSLCEKILNFFVGSNKSINSVEGSKMLASVSCLRFPSNLALSGFFVVSEIIVSNVEHKVQIYLSMSPDMLRSI